VRLRSMLVEGGFSALVFGAYVYFLDDYVAAELGGGFWASVGSMFAFVVLGWVIGWMLTLKWRKKE